jgi:hypothetical protein
MPTNSSVLPAGRQHTAPAGRRRRFGARRTLTIWSAAALATATFAGLAGPASASTPMYFGSVDGGYQQAQANTSAPIANHAYAQFSSKPPTARMITVAAGSASWKSVAAAGPGSTLYNQIVNWAQTIKARGGRVMVAYNHEPEASAGGQHGSAADFIAAYRHVESIFDNQGATNVEWTWQMTAYAFRVSPSSSQYAAKWYPGDAYVDNVGGDAYNWNTCGVGSGKYNELQFLGDPILAFARAHHKAASFPEFASNQDSKRPTWLDNAHQYFLKNQDVLSAAFYFNRPPTVKANSDCHWGLSSSADWQAFNRISNDRSHFSS